MSVHYKFKTASANDYSTITFDGIHISVSDLKKAIIDQKRLNKSADSDLQIINAQTNDVYENDDSLIPKNTSVLVARVPITGDKKRSNNGAGAGVGGIGGFPNRRNFPPPPASSQPSPFNKGVDITTMEGTEEDRINEMMNQSAADYDPANLPRLKGQSQTGRVPNYYRCNKCNQAGHWIKDCPQIHKAEGGPGGVKKSTGIPRIFMVNVEGPQVPGALLTPEGRYAVPAVDHAAYMDKSKSQVEAPPPKHKIPDELLCSLCQDLLTDALLVPCCANSYCDECIRSALVDSEDNECPGCHEKEISPTSLIPNRFLRTAVNAFKNETGYSKPQKVESSRAPPTTVDLTDSQPKERTLSLDDLPEDLFPHSPRKVEEEQEKKKEETKDADSDDTPSPFASGDGTKENSDQNIQTVGSKPRPFGNGPPGVHRNSSPPRRETFRGGHARTPLQSGMPLPGQHFKSPREPPPPGFEDGSPGGDKPRGDDHRGPPNRHYEDQNRPPPMHGPGPPPLMMGMSGPPPFNPMMPPGFMGPGMMGPPGMFPGPPMGPMPPFMHPPPFGPPGPPHMFPPHGGRPPFDRDRYHQRDRERDRDLDRDRDRERRRYAPRDRRDEPIVSGGLEDPLKEFERLMREQDLRKEMAIAVQTGNAVKRSPSSPPRSPPSPFLKRGSRSPFSRSPSPKRQRVIAPPRRRNSYSRSKSRSPRRVTRSRSPMGVAPIKRRAPPYSPSPPPSSRYYPPRKQEKNEYYDNRSSRYESSRYHSSKPYDRPRDPRDRDYEKRYENSSRKYDSSSTAPKKYDSSNSASKYDHPRSSSRTYHPSSREHEEQPRSAEFQANTESQPISSNPGPPSLLELNIKSPPHLTKEENLAFYKADADYGNGTRDVKIVLPSNPEEKPDTHHHHHKEKHDDKEKKVKKEKRKHKKKTKDEKEKSKKKKKKDKEDSEEGGSAESTNTSRRTSGEVETELEIGTEKEMGQGSVPAAVICDSTVKSPDHGLKEGLMAELLKPELLVPLIGTIDIAPGLLDMEFPKAEEHLAATNIDNKSIEVPILPPSKWDNDEDLDGPPGEEAIRPKVIFSSPHQQDEKLAVVTSEVLKRAESAIFQKIGTSAPPSKLPASPKRHSSGSGNKSQGLERENRSHYSSDTQGETTAKRSVRDRLGSKIEDPPPNPIHPSKQSSRERERGNSRDRDRERARDSRRERQRSRSPITLKELRRSRTPDRRPRDERQYRDRLQIHPRRDERDRDRERERDRARQRSRDRERGHDEFRQRSDSRSRRRGRPRSRSHERSHERSRPKSSGGPRSEVKIEDKKKDDWKLSEKFKPIPTQDVFETAYVKTEDEKQNSAPVPLAVRKQKRINIKLTSTSKADAESDSSSSDDDAATEKVRTSIETDDEKKKKKKKMKRRKSDSTESSSSSDEEKRSKKKSKKKKKKKSKKKK